MIKKKLYYFIGGGVVLLILAYMSRPAWYTITDWLIPEFEGFLPSPKWDNQQYSWGYGTRAPGSTGTISKEQALIDMRKYLQDDYNYYQGRVTVPLQGYQWAAFLSFAYNLGRGDANDLLPYINSNDTEGLGYEWNRYVFSGGSRSTDLVARRAQEWKIWRGQV